MSVFAGGNFGYGYNYYSNPVDNFVDPLVEQEAENAEDRINAIQEELEEAKKNAQSANNNDNTMGVFAEVGPSAAGMYREKVSFTA